MTADFNPGRLRLARRRRGLTKIALARRIGVSSRSMTAFERGEIPPGRDTLAKLATVLDFPVSFFWGPDLDEPPEEGSSFRALTTLTASQRHQTLGAGALALALSEWIDARFSLPDADVPQLQGVDPETAAVAIRGEWGLGERPIRNMVHLLESHGVRVFSLAEDCTAMDAFSFWRGNTPYVFLNTLKTAERSRQDAAHELGHLVMHWKGGAQGREAEYQAQLFGSAFLMPRGSILADAPRAGGLLQINQAKRRWNVSAANLAHRMRALDMLSEWQYRSIFVEISRRGLRAAEAGGTQRETSQVLTKVFKALREEGISMSDVAHQLGIMPSELSKLVFGLTLTPVQATSEPNSTTEPPVTEPPMLRLL
jgi:Zn-dependent peptidase ImmA (M78 family)/DNA-binding XRE family transcriptional regulator